MTEPSAKIATSVFSKWSNPDKYSRQNSQSVIATFKYLAGISTSFIATAFFPSTEYAIVNLYSASSNLNRIASPVLSPNILLSATIDSKLLSALGSILTVTPLVALPS